MRCVIKGTGPPLLFIHGWAMHAGVWADLAGAFSHKYQTIAVDLPGHGASRSEPGPYGYGDCARAIIGLLHDLGLKAAAAVGWSMGASVLIRANTLAPGLFPRLVFMSANPSLVTRPDYPCGIPEATVRRLYRQVERAYPEGLKNFYDLLLSGSERGQFGPDPRYAAMTDPLQAPDKPAALATLTSLMREDLRAELGSVGASCLILHGAADGICNPQAAPFMHAAIPGSRLVQLAGAGHAPFLTRREKTIGSLREFLDAP